MVDAEAQFLEIRGNSCIRANRVPTGFGTDANDGMNLGGKRA